jgi:hypothetical protein
LQYAGLQTTGCWDFSRLSLIVVKLSGREGQWVSTAGRLLMLKKVIFYFVYEVKKGLQDVSAEVGI